MDSSSLLTAVVLANVAFMVVILVVLLRRVGDAASTTEVTRQLRDQVGETGRLMGELGNQVNAAQIESRVAVAESQAKNLEVLQTQVTGVVELVNKQLEEVRRSMGDNMKNLTGVVTEQLSGSAKVINEVKGQLGGLAVTAKNIQELGRDIASLQDILRAPKLRGNLGELFLEEILKQVLPSELYSMQYTLPATEDGKSVRVDAVIRLGDKLVPIDSKFPLESFQRLLAAESDDQRKKHRKEFIDAVRKQVDEIADRYIRPEAGTYEFALMYLPAENVYYEAVIRDDGIDGVVAYAARKKVVPVSPNTLYAYLLTIAYGLKGMQIEKQAEAIRSQLASFQKKFKLFFDLFGKVGKNLDLANRQYEEAAKRGVKLNDQVGKITGTILDLDEADELSDGTAAASLESPGA